MSNSDNISAKNSGLWEILNGRNDEEAIIKLLRDSWREGLIDYKTERNGDRLRDAYFRDGWITEIFSDGVVQKYNDKKRLKILHPDGAVESISYRFVKFKRGGQKQERAAWVKKVTLPNREPKFYTKFSRKDEWRLVQKENKPSQMPTTAVDRAQKLGQPTYTGSVTK